MGIVYNQADIEAKAVKYSHSIRASVVLQLGFGTQGMVFRTNRNTAIKVYDREDGYRREHAIYQRLKERKIFEIRGLMIPRLKRHDDTLFVIEMSVVHVPCIIDFGGAYLDFAPEHMVRDEMWEEQKAEEFGAYWEYAKAVIREIEYRANIWLADVNTGNIKFE